MCFHIKVSKESQLQKNKRFLFKEVNHTVIDKLLGETDLPIYHISGFEHPKIFIYTNESPNFPIIAQWGLIPNWVQSENQKNELWNKTLNARSESIFEKPSFKDAANNKRCIIYIDGFYEYHHFKGKTYPYYVFQKNNRPMAVGGLYNSWLNPITQKKMNSFSIVTVKGNEFMSTIHNNPKLKEARCPLILKEDKEDFWLFNVNQPRDIEPLKNIAENVLDAYTVRPLSGKNYIGNTKSISYPYHYPDLHPLTLF